LGKLVGVWFCGFSSQELPSFARFARVGEPSLRIPN
jgi:hypothetical protein